MSTGAQNPKIEKGRSDADTCCGRSFVPRLLPATIFPGVVLPCVAILPFFHSSTHPLLDSSNLPFFQPAFGSRMITLMAAAVLVLQFLMAGQRMLIANIRLFAVQSFLLAGIANTIAWFQHSPHLHTVAVLTFVLKVLAVPWFLRRVMQRIQAVGEVEPAVNTPASMLLCGGLTLLAYVVARPFTASRLANASDFGHNVLAVAIALVLVGFYLMIVRRTALAQVLALLTVENGIFLAAISLTYGMPLVVELGVFFDVFVAVMVFGILVYRIRATFESVDVSKLSSLKG
jgi:hydrogenase-4 component E